MASGFSIGIKFGPDLDVPKLNGMLRGLAGQLKGFAKGLKVLDPSAMLSEFRQAEGVAEKFKAAMKGLLGGQQDFN